MVLNLCLCVLVCRSCNVCVNTTPVERAVTSVAPVTTKCHGNQEPSPRETHVKVRVAQSTCLPLFHLSLSHTHLSLTCFSECNCHNKAVDCFYNQTVAELHLSLNSYGVHEGGGVCIDCQQNTAGINCETCKDGFYRPTEVRVTHVDRDDSMIMTSKLHLKLNSLCFCGFVGLSKCIIWWQY